MPTNPRSNVPVKSVVKTFRIIQTLQDLNGAEVTTIANQLDISKSTVHNHLATLEKLEYVTHEDDTYRISFRFLDHGGHALERDDRLSLVEPKVTKIAEETGELCQFMVEEHGRGVIIFREEGDNAVETEPRVGTRLYLNHTTAGKAILAGYSDEKVKSFVERHGLPPKTDQTITELDELLDTLERIRDRGYVFDQEEHIKGLHAIGVPIVENEQRVLGALSVAAPSHRLQSEQQRRELADYLLGVANELELNVSFR